MLKWLKLMSEHGAACTSFSETIMRHKSFIDGDEQQKYQIHTFIVGPRTRNYSETTNVPSPAKPTLHTLPVHGHQ